MKRKWLYSESRLSEVLGLSRAQLKACRVKGEYRHGRGKGGPVELSQRGVEKVLEKFGIQEANLDGARIKGSSESQPALNQESEVSPCPECGAGRKFNASICALIHTSTQLIECPVPSSIFDPLKLVHVSQLVPNKRILRATNGTGEIYNVIVPSSETWAIGDPLRIKPSATHQGYWQLEGKAPRWRGDRIYRHEFV